MGYRTSTDLLRGYLADVVPKSTIDSLQTYTMQEVSVEGERDITTTAKQELRVLSRRAPSIIRSMIGRASPQARTRQLLTLGAGGSNVIVGARTTNVPATLISLESKTASEISLNELVTFLRNNVALLDNAKARKLMNDIVNAQQSVAMFSQANTSENAMLIREQLYTISARIQELEKVLDEPAK